MPRGNVFLLPHKQQTPETTPKQNHLGTLTSTIKLGPVLENHQAALHTSLSSTMVCSDLCTKLKHVQKGAPKSTKHLCYL